MDILNKNKWKADKARIRALTQFSNPENRLKHSMIIKEMINQGQLKPSGQIGNKGNRTARSTETRSKTSFSLRKYWFYQDTSKLSERNRRAALIRWNKHDK